VRVKGGCTVVEAVAVTVGLLSAEALAVFVISPGCVGVTLIVTVARAFLARLPRLQVTVPLACVQLPVVAPLVNVAESKLTPFGKVSVILTVFARSVPLLATSRV
jgi:hypothetical protein